MLQDLPLQAIFHALFVPLFLMPVQLKRVHYTLQSWYEAIQLCLKNKPIRENYRNIDTILIHFLLI